MTTRIIQSCADSHTLLIYGFRSVGVGVVVAYYTCQILFIYYFIFASNLSLAIALISPTSLILRTRESIRRKSRLETSVL